MSDLLQSWLAGLTAMSLWELVGVALGFVYLVLAIRQNIGCWIAAALSEIIFIFIMADARLYMESALRVFYLGMAGYGWYQWTHGLNRQAALKVTQWPWRYHLAAISVLTGLVIVSGTLLSAYTDAALPYWDAFTTWFAVFATWLVAKKLLENWYYWFVIDAVSVWLYAERGLVFVATLYAVYLVMIVFGYKTWKASMGDTNVLRTA